MGLTYADLSLSNPKEPQLKDFETKALVDSGTLYLCIPQHVATQLKLEKLEDREVILADGQRKSFPYVGPILIQFENRSSFMGAMVFGDEVLLGAIPMEDMDVIIHPLKQKLIVNPENPNMTCGKAK